MCQLHHGQLQSCHIDSPNVELTAALQDLTMTTIMCLEDIRCLLHVQLHLEV